MGLCFNKANDINIQTPRVKPNSTKVRVAKLTSRSKLILKNLGYKINKKPKKHVF